MRNCLPPMRQSITKDTSNVCLLSAESIRLLLQQFYLKNEIEVSSRTLCLSHASSTVLIKSDRKCWMLLEDGEGPPMRVGQLRRTISSTKSLINSFTANNKRIYKRSTDSTSKALRLQVYSLMRIFLHLPHTSTNIRPSNF